MRFRTGYVFLFSLVGLAILATILLYLSSQGDGLSASGMMAALVVVWLFIAVMAIYAVWSVINFVRYWHRRFTRSHLYQPAQGTVSKMWEQNLTFPLWLFLDNPQIIVAKYSFAGKSLTTYLTTMNSQAIEQALEEKTIDLRVDPDYHHDVMIEANWAKKHSPSNDGISQHVDDEEEE